MVKTARYSTGLCFISLLGALAVLPTRAYAAQAGRIVTLRGKGTVESAKGSVPLTLGARLSEGDIVKTGPQSSARLLMSDRSLIDLGPNTRITITAYQVHKKEKTRKASIKVWLGKLWARVTKAANADKNFEVNSDNAVAGVRGTAFYFDVGANGETTLTVTEGSVDFGSPGQEPTPVGAMRRGVMAGSDDGGGQGGDGGTEGGDEDGGTPVVTEVTVEEVEQLGADVHPGTDDSGAGGAEGDSGAGDGSTGGGDGSTGDDSNQGSDETDGIDGEQTEAPVDLDPWAGRGRVRGTVEVRP